MQICQAWQPLRIAESARLSAGWLGRGAQLMSPGFRMVSFGLAQRAAARSMVLAWIASRPWPEVCGRVLLGGAEVGPQVVMSRGFKSAVPVSRAIVA